MRKKIGIKVVASMLVLTVVFLITISLNSSSVNELSKSAKLISDQYLSLETYSSTLVKNNQTCKLNSNLIVLSTSASTSSSLASSAAQIIANVQMTKTTMLKLCQKIGNDDLTKAFQDYYDSLTDMTNAFQSVADFYLAGKYDEALAKNNEIYTLSTTVTKYENAYEACLSENVEAITSKVHSQIKRTTVITNSMVVVFIIFAICSGLYLAITIVYPAKNANKQLKKITTDINNNSGDLTQRIKVRSKDEVGQLVSGINVFMTELQSIMKKIQSESLSMINSAETMQNGVNNSNENANSVSASMEELAATMQEVAATVDQITTNAQTVLASATEMRENAGNGASLALDIKNRASEISEKTAANMDSATKMVAERKVVLKESIENSRNAEKIADFVEQILNITNQTNLLALNASIEAARAGDAGRGFAVVAEQIRVLADDSRAAATNIQALSNVVIDSVNTLSDNADEMLNFVSTDILNDFSEFVDIAACYSQDADKVEHIMNRFNENAQELEETMSNITDGIDGINTAVDESARGVADASESTTTLVNALALIKTEADGNQHIAELLSDEVKKFKQI